MIYDKSWMETLFRAKNAYIWRAVAQCLNAKLSIERVTVRIHFTTVSKLGHFHSLHDAPAH